MKKGQARLRSQARGAEQAASTALAAQTQELLRAIAMKDEAGVLTAQEHGALAKLIDALARLLCEVPEDI